MADSTYTENAASVSVHLIEGFFEIEVWISKKNMSIFTIDFMNPTGCSANFLYLCIFWQIHGVS